MCGDLGYNYTTLSRETQEYTFKVAFNKDLDSALLNKSDFSLPAWLEKQLSKYKPECASVLRKLYCAQWLPPCFPKANSSQFYGLCKSECETVHHLCPGFFDNHPLDGLDFCADYPEKKSVQNFCEHSQWPRRNAHNFSKCLFLLFIFVIVKKSLSGSVSGHRRQSGFTIPSYYLWPPLAVRPPWVGVLRRIPWRYTPDRQCVFHPAIVCHGMVPRDRSVVLGWTLGVPNGALTISFVRFAPVF